MKNKDNGYELKNDLKKIRKRLDITQEELANAIGVQKAYYSRLERGQFIPNIKTCLMIHEAMLILYFDRTGKHLEKLTINRLFYLEKTER